MTASGPKLLTPGRCSCLFRLASGHFSQKWYSAKAGDVVLLVYDLSYALKIWMFLIGDDVDMVTGRVQNIDL